MAILSVSEFETVLSQAVLHLQSWMHANGENPDIKKAIRSLEQIRDCAREAAPLKSKRSLLESTSDSLQAKLPDDEKLRNDMWDCLDYIDYRA